MRSLAAVAVAVVAVVGRCFLVAATGAGRDCSIGSLGLEMEGAVTVVAQLGKSLSRRGRSRRERAMGSLDPLLGMRLVR